VAYSKAKLESNDNKASEMHQTDVYLHELSIGPVQTHFN
jgi:hypothetical protein